MIGPRGWNIAAAIVIALSGITLLGVSLSAVWTCPRHGACASADTYWRIAATAMFSVVVGTCLPLIGEAVSALRRYVEDEP